MFTITSLTTFGFCLPGIRFGIPHKREQDQDPFNGHLSQTTRVSLHQKSQTNQIFIEAGGSGII